MPLAPPPPRLIGQKNVFVFKKPKIDFDIFFSLQIFGLKSHILCKYFNLKTVTFPADK